MRSLVASSVPEPGWGCGMAGNSRNTRKRQVDQLLAEMESQAANPPSRSVLKIPHAKDTSLPLGRDIQEVPVPPVFKGDVNQIANTSIASSSPNTRPVIVLPDASNSHLGVKVTGKRRRLPYNLVIACICGLFLASTVFLTAYQFQATGSKWTAAQEAVRKYTRLPRNQIHAPIDLNRVKVWLSGGDPGRIYSLRMYQDEIMPQWWHAPEGEGVFVVAIHGDPDAPFPQKKVGYFVDVNNKIRFHVDEENIKIDGERIEGPQFPNFRLEEKRVDEVQKGVKGLFNW
jgi:hypothetical protein